ncbi:MAG: hypothetical protein U0353_01110 [Sandaracinus sp.]
MTHTTRSTLVLALLLAACDHPAVGDDAGRTSDASDAPLTPDAAVAVDVGTDAAVEHAPLFRNEVTLPDAELAQQALRLMGAPEAGGSGSCHDCHGLTRNSIAQMRTISDTAWSSCFADLDPATPAAAQAIIACFRDARDEFHTGNLGVFATGATSPWFQYVFRRAYGATWETEYAQFTMRVQQPPAPATALTQAEFDLLTEWFLRGTPQLDAVLPAPDGPGECTPYVSAAAAALATEGARSGWTARNAEASILMHGCAGAASPLDCLSSYPRASETSYGAEWEVPAGTHQRVLFETDYATSYWTRSSADGRFVAHGGSRDGSGASIIDLERRVVLGVDAAYDPGFYPDNSGFVFQGTRRGAGSCSQSVLTTGMPTHITFSESGCASPGMVGLYQHLGASLDGGDYWIVNSVWSGDPGDDLSDPAVFADARSATTLLRFTNTGSGTGFTPAGSVEATTPWEGNSVISPSMRMLVGHIADAGGRPLGYVLHSIELRRDGTGRATSVSFPEIARYCAPGGKVAVSLDDRWIVTHHRATDADAVDLGFSGPSDPAFAAYRGVSNVYLIDILTGEETRITNMQPGQRALFPHFRSDGWIYFLVRDSSATERIVATDAALVLAAAP